MPKPTAVMIEQMVDPDTGTAWVKASDLANILHKFAALTREDMSLSRGSLAHNLDNIANFLDGKDEPNVTHLSGTREEAEIQRQILEMEARGQSVSLNNSNKLMN